MANVVLPVRPVVKPACLKGQRNGELNPSLFEPCGIGNFKMVAPAARAMRALVAAAKQRGFEVRATGTYRSLEQQKQLFLSRYTTEELPGRPTRVWNGVTYWQKPGTAMAAAPGTSNHGWGLAIDFAEERDGDAQVESVSQDFVKWLIKYGNMFAYSFEAQSEPWHLRYTAGDQIPEAVRAYEASLGTTVPVAPVEPAPVVPVEPVKPAGRTHTVVKGDSWWKIAAKYLGKGQLYRRVQAANPSVTTLRPGLVINIPEVN